MGKDAAKLKLTIPGYYLHTASKSSKSSKSSNSLTCIICNCDSEDDNDSDSDSDSNSRQYSQLAFKGNLVCSHQFHTQCLYNWFGISQKISCPICRQPDLELGLEYPLLTPLVSQRRLIIHYYPSPSGKPKVKKKYWINGWQKHGLSLKYYSNKVMKEKCKYQNGRLHGLYQKWYSNKQLKYHQVYSHGLLSGLYQVFYRNGQLQVQAHYQDNYVNGSVKVCDPNGLTLFEGELRDWKLIR